MTGGSCRTCKRVKITVWVIVRRLSTTSEWWKKLPRCWASHLRLVCGWDYWRFLCTCNVIATKYVSLYWSCLSSCCLVYLNLPSRLFIEYPPACCSENLWNRSCHDAGSHALWCGGRGPVYFWAQHDHFRISPLFCTPECEPRGIPQLDPCFCFFVNRQPAQPRSCMPTDQSIITLIWTSLMYMTSSLRCGYELLRHRSFNY